MRRLSVATAAAAAALLMSGCVVYPSHGYRHVSGGPVYRVRTTQTGVLWSPTSDATLVGIATEFVNRRELALPWWRWSKWVGDVMAK